MGISGIDPFLYRSQESDLEKRIRREASRTPSVSGFDEMLRELPEDRRANISSDQFSRIPDRETVHAHIGDDPQKAKLYEAAKQFEAFFFEKMYREMKKNVPKDDFINGGFAEEVFDEMLTTERVGQAVHQSQFGLAEMMYRQLQGF